MPKLQSGAMTITARVVDPSTGKSTYGRFRVDTGDDIVLFSPALIRALGAKPMTTTTVEGIDGRISTVEAYDLDLDLGPMGYVAGVKVLAYDVSSLGYDGLLGDDALDAGVLVRDGPGGQWSFVVGTVSPPPPSYAVPVAIGLAGIAAVAVALAWPRR